MNRKRESNPPVSAPNLVHELRSLAIQAGHAYDRQGAAFDAERAAEVELLAKALELVKPGLPAICNEIGRTGIYGVEIVPGVWIYGDGKLGEVGGDDGTAYLPRTPAEVLEEIMLLEILAPLGQLLDKQIKGRAPSTLEAEHRAAKLHALVHLLEEK